MLLDYLRWYFTSRQALLKTVKAQQKQLEKIEYIASHPREHVTHQTLRGRLLAIKLLAKGEADDKN